MVHGHSSYNATLALRPTWTTLWTITTCRTLVMHEQRVASQQARPRGASILLDAAASAAARRPSDSCRSRRPPAGGDGQHVAESVLHLVQAQVLAVLEVRRQP